MCVCVGRGEDDEEGEEGKKKREKVLIKIVMSKVTSTSLKYIFINIGM